MVLVVGVATVIDGWVPLRALLPQALLPQANLYWKALLQVLRALLLQVQNLQSSPGMLSG